MENELSRHSPEAEEVLLKIEVHNNRGQIFIDFEAQTAEEANMFNLAANKVLSKVCDPTPHVQSESGLQRWETWVLTEERVRELVEDIKAEMKLINEERNRPS